MKTPIHIVSATIIAVLIFSATPHLASKAYAIDACELEYSNDGSDSDDPCVVINDTSLFQNEAPGKYSGCTFKTILERIALEPDYCRIDALDFRGANAVLFQPKMFPIPYEEKSYTSGSTYVDITRNNIIGRAKAGITKTAIDEPIDISFDSQGVYNPWSRGERQGVLISGAIPIFPEECMGNDCERPANDDTINVWAHNILHEQIEETLDKVIEEKKVAIVDHFSIVDGFNQKAEIEIDLEDEDAFAFTLKGNADIVFQDIKFVVKRGRLMELDGVGVTFDRCLILDKRDADSNSDKALIVSSHPSQARFESAGYYMESGRDSLGPTHVALRKAPLVFSKDEKELTWNSPKGLIVGWPDYIETPHPFLVEGKRGKVACEIGIGGTSCELKAVPKLLFRARSSETNEPGTENVCPWVSEGTYNPGYVCDSVIDLTDYDPNEEFYFNEYGQVIEFEYPKCPDGRDMNVYAKPNERCVTPNGYYDLEHGQIRCDMGYTRKWSDVLGFEVCVSAVDCPRGSHFDLESASPVKFCALDDGNEWSSDRQSAWPECPGDAIPNGKGEPQEQADGVYSYCICPDGNVPYWRFGVSRCGYTNRFRPGGNQGGTNVAFTPFGQHQVIKLLDQDDPGKDDPAVDTLCPDGSAPVLGICRSDGGTSLNSNSSDATVGTDGGGCSVAPTVGATSLPCLLILLGTFFTIVRLRD